MKTASRCFISAAFLASTLLTFFSCSQKPETDPCCAFTHIPATNNIKTGEGALQVNGKTDAYFYVFDENGKQVQYQGLNKTLSLDPGNYTVKVNNSAYGVEVRAGFLAECSTGTLLIKGHTADYYYVMDSTGQQLAYQSLGKAMSFFPSEVMVKVNNTELPADVKINQVVEIETGTLVVRGNTSEYYYVLDAMNKQLNYNSLEKPLAFLPGTYGVKVNNTSMVADISGGRVTELGTGTLTVKGLTDEYYYAIDTLGNALNYQSLNKSLAFFPGTVQIKVNNTLTSARITGGAATELITGSLILTGGGSDYYYVLDQTGNQLNYNSINKSLSFFPSEYVVRLGKNSRKATVLPGQLTSLTAF